MKIYETPAGTNGTVNQPNKDDELLEKEKQEKYQSKVRIILWLMQHSKPNISNTVREASKAMDGYYKETLDLFIENN
jgi:hypothetical protein